MSCYGCAVPGCVVPGCASEGTVIPAQPVPTMPSAHNGIGSARKAPATVVVKAPTDVRLRFDGQQTTRTKAQETFATPALQAGRRYSYQVEAETVRNGKRVTRTRRVFVRAGERTEIDFSDLAAPQTTVVHQTQSEPAHVTVELPDNARLFVDGRHFTTGSGRRSFNTPKLKPGKNYHYTFKAEVQRNGRTISETREAQVAAGKSITVTFPKLSAVRTARK